MVQREKTRRRRFTIAAIAIVLAIIVTTGVYVIYVLSQGGEATGTASSISPTATRASPETPTVTPSLTVTSTATPTPTAPLTATSPPTVTPTATTKPTPTPTPSPFYIGDEKSVARNAHTTQEQNALAATESANYTDILGMQRFKGFGSGAVEINDYSRYVYANFVDSNVIDYYNTRFETLKGKTKGVDFNYEANVYSWTQLAHVNFSSNSITVVGADGTNLFRNANAPGGGMAFFQGNGSGYRKIQGGTIDLAASDHYLVEMKLDYLEVYGSLAGFESIVYQVIITDQSFTPLLVCINSGYIIM